MYLKQKYIVYQPKDEHAYSVALRYLYQTIQIQINKEIEKIGHNIRNTINIKPHYSREPSQ